jgi:hypothetical protein
MQNEAVKKFNTSKQLVMCSSVAKYRSGLGAGKLSELQAAAAKQHSSGSMTGKLVRRWVYS